MLTRETFTGPWAGLPVSWTDDERFDEQTYRGDIARCCQVGAPGIYTGGTTGEFYAQELDEFKAVTRAAVAECRAQKKPVMIGCSSTYTLGVCRRAAIAAECGADAIQVTLPFWMVIEDHQVVPFFKEVAKAAGKLALSIYETSRCKKKLTVQQHQAVKEAVPSYLMVKANATTVGDTAEGCAALTKLGINVFAGEDRWGELGPQGAIGGCSSLVYWNPRVTLGTWREVEKKNWPAVRQGCDQIHQLFLFLGKQYAGRGLEDSAFDRLGARLNGFLKVPLRCRGPYPSAIDADVEALRRWCSEHFPEFVKL
jgi:dihydrodipicolinate synthase/N-acetylneuraminate lyase